ncbi:hypothetical protein IMY05_C4700000400 [Salix suchowensis]|nr:hypothetical protein IMY05_C4700000400 [Salix suchowensis]
MSPLAVQSSLSTVGENPSARPISTSSPLTATSGHSTIDDNTQSEPKSGVSPLSAHSSQSTIHGIYQPMSLCLLFSQLRLCFESAWLRPYNATATSWRLPIRVGDKWYITAGTLSDSRAERICGRCTRVWRVYEDKKYEEAKRKQLPAYRERGLMDSQFIGILDLEPSPSIPDIVAAHIGRPIPYSRSTDMEPRAKRAKKRPRYHPRTHDDLFGKRFVRHIMIKTTCSPESDVGGCTRYSSDISTGNILYDSENGRLGDLEYVVFYDDEPSPVHNVKTVSLIIL